jgi:hypothetical protein
MPRHLLTVSTLARLELPNGHVSSTYNNKLFFLLTWNPVPVYHPSFCVVCFKIPIATVPFLETFLRRPRWPVAETKERIFLSNIFTA